MNFYLIANLIHILGALGFFIALAIETVSLFYARRAESAEQTLERLRLPKHMQRLGPLSMLLIVASGIYMTVTVWGGVAWIIVALVSLALMVVIALTLGVPRMAAIEKALAERQDISTLKILLNDWALWLSIELRLSLAFGIIFLMALKPSLVWSLIIIGVSLMVGVWLSLSMRKPKEAANASAS